MQSRLITVCALLAALFCTLSLTSSGRLADAASALGQEPAASGNNKNPAHDCSPVAALDECIQKRFSAMDRFGIRRVITYPYHLQHFSPENETEKSVIAELERQGWTVSFYLAGRSVLEAKPDKALWEKSAGYFYKRKPINNPVLLTKDAGIEDLPKPLELWEQTQQRWQPSAGLSSTIFQSAGGSSRRARCGPRRQPVCNATISGLK